MNTPREPRKEDGETAHRMRTAVPYRYLGTGIPRPGGVPVLCATGLSKRYLTALESSNGCWKRKRGYKESRGAVVCEEWGGERVHREIFFGQLRN